MSFTLRVRFIKQAKHPRIFYVTYKIIFSNLDLKIVQKAEVEMYTSPLSFAMDLTSLRCSSLSSIPYSSHITMYSCREIVPSPPVSALSKSSHKAEFGNYLRIINILDTWHTAVLASVPNILSDHWNHSSVWSHCVCSEHWDQDLDLRVICVYVRRDIWSHGFLPTDC